ncbi:methyltransferase FkbM family [Reticulomyxa filosa]|uniref:Methyltransferase FkbM family n=1 Tax=Reticulomyxa filosa TaxID=46433 RepID=X6LVR4_RETFI|nr:methyltransferase FkbM family [Reticulomyxa filosa]|eukprot:ETO05719.1 methyltransferase FkbM family [Reticulomyxa filosa]
MKISLTSKSLLLYCLTLAILCMLWLALDPTYSQPLKGIPTSLTVIKPQKVWDWSVGNYNVEEMLAKVSPIHKEHCRRMLTKSTYLPAKETWSQGYQDWYIYYNYFEGPFFLRQCTHTKKKKKKGKTDGVYVDMGANVPFKLSNTAFFDVCLGWKGICVEPSYHSVEFEANRTCTVAKHCMYSRSQKLVMSAAEDISQILQPRNDIEELKKLNKAFECDGISAKDLLNKYPAKNKLGEITSLAVDYNLNKTALAAQPKIDIDFISLDIEGSEVELLRCFPFDHYRIKVWSIEVNKNEILIDEIMLAHGYVKETYLTFYMNGLDAVYVWKPRVMKEPWKEEQRAHWKRYKRCEP